MLLENPDKLDQAGHESARLKQALELKASLAAAYDLKEDLRGSWNQPGKELAAPFLEAWINRARTTGIRPLRQMANTLSLHRASPLGYYDVPITSAPLEGINTRILLLKRQAYGYREFFNLALYALHESCLALVG